MANKQLWGRGMVEVHLYGRLRRHAAHRRPDQESVVRLESRAEDTVGAVLERLGISPTDVCHVFLNGAVVSTRNSMAPWLRYRQVHEEAEERVSADRHSVVPGSAPGMDIPVRSGDRLGLFAHDMALLVV
jgi:hypothetical protein